MAKSKYEFWLSTNDNKERFRFPILPEVLSISSGSDNESVNIVSLGELTILQEPQAKIFQFSTFFSFYPIPMLEYSNPIKPQDAVSLLQKWRKHKVPLRFLVTNTSINTPVSVDNFRYLEKGGSVGDIYYNLTLKEYKLTTIRKITVEAPKQARPGTNTNSRIHTVVRGDTLWGLARRFYGSGAQWTRIWNVKSNQDMLIKRDSRNIRQPGHWIHPGQRLVIP